MSVIIKPGLANIISLWFGVDTPLRQRKINLNTELWMACQAANERFQPPSGVKQISLYRRADKAAFARAVQQELVHTQHAQEEPVLAVAGREADYSRDW